METQFKNDVRKTITHFLIENKAYSSLPTNSRLPLLHPKLNLLQAVQLIHNFNYREAIIINQKRQPALLFQDWDIVKCCLAIYQQQKDSQGQLSHKIKQRLQNTPLSGLGRPLLKTSIDQLLSALIFSMNSGGADKIGLFQRSQDNICCVVSYLDILKFMVRKMNQEMKDRVYDLQVSFPQMDCKLQRAVSQDQSLYDAFSIMLLNKSSYVQVHDQHGRFSNLILVNDLRNIILSNKLALLKSPVKLFLATRSQTAPFRIIRANVSIREMVQQILTSECHIVVRIQSDQTVHSILGLSQLFSLYI